MGAQKVLDYISDNNIRSIELRMTDILGRWHHMSFPASYVDEKMLTDGIFFDGSSIVQWKEIHQSDMIMKPDLSRIIQDPFSAHESIALFCDIYDPITNERYDRDPRSIAWRAEEYLKSTKIATTAYFGPEAEFFIFDGIRFGTGPEGSFYEIEADEFNHVNADPFGPNSHGHRPHVKTAYFPVAPMDSLQDMRTEMMETMALMGLAMERHHHEVAPAQHEIGFRFGTLLQTADNLQIYKYVVKNVAHSYGKTATFMPKPVYGDNGSGMHVHQSLWNNDDALFYGKDVHDLSELALYYIGGILKHAKALNAFTNPTTNSYKRLVPGFEAPVILAYSAQNRSAACRIPLSTENKAKRVEVRFPDPLANPYLCFSAMLMAGLDGIKNKIHPGTPADIDLFKHKELSSQLPTVSGSLREALTHLEQDYQFLMQGNVFSQNFLEAYMSLKWAEVYAYEMAPHPIEFQQYYAL